MQDDSRFRRVAGLGSGRNGLGDWRLQRLTALALLPLGSFFVVSVLRLATARGDTAAEWLGRPLNGFVMLLFVAAVTSHSVVGLRSVLADYVHGRVNSFLAGIVVRGLAVMLCVAGILAILKAFVGGGAS
ncbi:succinate dehydrogenase, hydrophobic membrane anchor protein [Sphingosinicellaceae bacterium]|nr:succinate dehydrogenase, hydrophobic membrane anchor protein [Sphingosinicellaceae bacterium]